MAGRRPSRVVAVVGGTFHDMGFVESRLREMLSTLPRGSGITVHADFTGLTAGLDPHAFLITYTNNVFPDERGLDSLRTFLQAGGRWLALHSSAAYTEFVPPPIETAAGQLPGRTGTPDLHPEYMDLLGCRMISHLPQQEFVVEPSSPHHPLVAGIGSFKVTDEPFILEIRGTCEVLLQSRYVGDSPGYVGGPWLDDQPRAQLLVHRVGSGSVVYLPLGHCRDRHSLRPYIDEVTVQRCSWDAVEYTELLGRLLAWGTDNSILL